MDELKNCNLKRSAKVINLQVDMQEKNKEDTNYQYQQ